ncbi:MAG: glycosyltransferase [Thermodesulfovibrionales bacterium]|nr:glycosyltransferase [Thermodesulfovibrionales bacterium]
MVSVVIPAYNAEKTIAACLNSLMKQDYPGDYEVIVVDDGSADSTPDIVSGYERVRLIKQANAGPAAARNKGAADAKGEIILFTDSDCVPEGNWIKEMVDPFKDNRDVVGVKGRYRTKQRETTARFVQFEYEDKYRYMQKDKYIDFIDTYSAGFKREIFLEMLGYDTEFPVACAEDVELSFRLSKKGYKMIFNPNAVVYHIHPAGLKDYLRKKYKFAYWRIVAVKKNPEKILKDSHTPQIMKLQVLFPPVVLGSALLAIAYNSLMYFPLLCFFAFILTTIPFTIRTGKKDSMVGLISPVFLFLRSLSQFLGILGGVVYIFKNKYFKKIIKQAV